MTKRTESTQPVPPTKTSYALEELTRHSHGEKLDAAKRLLLEYGQFVTAQPGVASFCLGTLEREAADLPHSYLDQGGGAIIATLSGQHIGFVAWRGLPIPELATAWELKRLWTRPEARGTGIGRALVQAVLDRAGVANKSIILLDTAPDVMAAAYRLYRSMGFVDCPPYNGRSPEGIVYMSKALDPA